jgi:guanylate kinase
MKKQLLILASPSGGGKSTIAKHLMAVHPDLKFSVSATTRSMRPGEVNGREYHFLTRDEFSKAIDNYEFVEYEEIFGNLYGTLKSVIDNSIHKGERLIFDIDVKGALSLKKIYPNESLHIFVAPPSLDILEQRLRNRKTESEEQINTRLQRAAMEMSLQSQFDFVVVNNNLELALAESEGIVSREMY